MRLILLYKGVFQEQGFELRADEYGVEVVYLLYHGFHLGEMFAPEIGTDSVSESLGLADIDNSALSVDHKIDAGGLRKAVGFLAQKLMCHKKTIPAYTKKTCP